MIWWKPISDCFAAVGSWDKRPGFETRGLASQLMRARFPSFGSATIPANDRDSIKW
jgi:hypothetical protein